MNRFFFICSFSLLCCFGASGQNFLKADGKRIVDGSGNEVLLRSMGLGGWMLQEPYMLQFGGIASTQKEIRSHIEAVVGKERTDAFYAAWLANHCRKADVDSMAKWGFNSVRLPMHYNLYTLPVEEEPEAGKQTWLDKGFAMTDSLLNWCSANKMYLILDLHAAPGGQGSDRPISDRDTSKPSLWQSEANKQKTIALWRKLAQRYANEEWIGGYDLINETNWGFTDPNDKNGCAEKDNGPLRELLMKITTAIREVDKKHIIYLEANCWANNYSGIFPLWDDNLVVSFHKYWNFNDQNSLSGMLKIRDEHNVPLWLGESGENSNVWFRDAIHLVEKNNIGWAWWPLKKLGHNNPLQIKQNEGYQQLLAYWKGEAKKPAADDAYKALMQFAEDSKAENCVFHPDVVDAMFRQVQTNETLPFKNISLTNSALVYAADYDLGRNGFAYYDLDTANYHVSGIRSVGNKGNIYRNDGVDIEACSDKTTNGFNVYSTEKGEWLQYTINAPAKAKYDLELRYAAKDSAASMRFVTNQTGNPGVFLPVTSGWSTVKAGSITLEKGKNTVRIFVEKGGAKLNYFRLVKQ